MSGIPNLTFDAAMAAFAPYEARPHLAVAVSGGSDSMALALLAHAWAKARGGQVTAITIDHGLRAGSDREAAQVDTWMRARGIDHEVLPWTGPKPATGRQRRARDARYALIDSCCQRRHILHVLLGHTADDQAETYLMRLCHQSRPDGLAGMSAVRELRHCRVLRPLLGISREDLRAMLRAVTSNGSVQSTMARLPYCSNSMPSCKLHVEQLPQSPSPVIKKSTSFATTSSVSPGAGALAFDLE